ncbi:hypothetical protein HPP92_000963 [Vanilla planifolia]|uniref:Uncharacterized protein n=1 Tax=Vanilla planifolia TaxID=51239 RepID=A0A835S2F8_VANPL|nr:hypothetical protein HPP92_000963 [Vanilla planifolia]
MTRVRRLWIHKLESQQMGSAADGSLSLSVDQMAKKKVALLLQKLKKYELPELPPPQHDPELLTAEQLQAYKKMDSEIEIMFL